MSAVASTRSNDCSSPASRSSARFASRVSWLVRGHVLGKLALADEGVRRSRLVIRVRNLDFDFLRKLECLFSVHQAKGNSITIRCDSYLDDFGKLIQVHLLRCDSFKKPNRRRIRSAQRHLVRCPWTLANPPCPAMRLVGVVFRPIGPVTRCAPSRHALPHGGRSRGLAFRVFRDGRGGFKRRRTGSDLAAKRAVGIRRGIERTISAGAPIEMVRRQGHSAGRTRHRSRDFLFLRRRCPGGPNRCRGVCRKNGGYPLEGLGGPIDLDRRRGPQIRPLHCHRRRPVRAFYD